MVVKSGWLLGAGVGVGLPGRNSEAFQQQARGSHAGTDHQAQLAGRSSLRARVVRLEAGCLSGRSCRSLCSSTQELFVRDFGRCECLSLLGPGTSVRSGSAWTFQPPGCSVTAGSGVLPAQSLACLLGATVVVVACGWWRWLGSIVSGWSGARLNRASAGEQPPLPHPR